MVLWAYMPYLIICQLVANSRPDWQPSVWNYHLQQTSQQIINCCSEPETDMVGKEKQWAHISQKKLSRSWQGNRNSADCSLKAAVEGISFGFSPFTVGWDNKAA